MISGTELVVGIVAFLLFVLLIAIAGAAAYALFRMYKRFLRAVEDLTRMAETLGEIAKASTSFESIPKYIKGHAKIAGHMAVEMQKFREVMAAFAKLMLNPDDAKAPALQVPTEEDRDREFRIMEWLSEDQGRTRAEAADLFDDVAPIGAKESNNDERF